MKSGTVHLREKAGGTHTRAVANQEFNLSSNCSASSKCTKSRFTLHFFSCCGSVLIASPQVQCHIFAKSQLLLICPLLFNFTDVTVTVITVTAVTVTIAVTIHCTWVSQGFLLFLAEVKVSQHSLGEFLTNR